MGTNHGHSTDATSIKQLESFHMRSPRSILNIRWQVKVMKIEVLDRAGHSA